MREPIQIGGHWTCDKCGESYHSSIVHECGARQRHIEAAAAEIVASMAAQTDAVQPLSAAELDEIAVKYQAREGQLPYWVAYSMIGRLVATCRASIEDRERIDAMEDAGKEDTWLVPAGGGAWAVRSDTAFEELHPGTYPSFRAAVDAIRGVVPTLAMKRPSSDEVDRG